MLSSYDLPVEERDRILAALTEEQRLFVQESMVRGRKTLFARVMAAQKGAHIPEDATYEQIELLVDDWIYLRYEDAGEISDSLKCDCGRSLRYAHTVKNLKTGMSHTFGITHLELHTGIDAKIVAQIKHGFDAIDFELNEILYKAGSGWDLYRSAGERIPDGLVLPGEIERHLELGLPLLDRQINRLKRLIRQHQRVDEAFPVRYRRPEPAPLPPPPKEPEPEPEPEIGQAAFDFDWGFGGEPAPKAEKSTKAPVASLAPDMTSAIPEAPRGAEAYGQPLQLAERLRMPVLELVKQGVGSARVICELLIKSHGVPDNRFSTGKPSIYTAVCAFLDMQVRAGAAKLMEKDQNDRIYQGL
jgi:hypothetical protein